MSDISKQIALTGIKPSGTPHIGNLVGAIGPIVAMSHEAARTYMFIADLHSLNQVSDAAVIREKTYELAAMYLALGLNPAKTVLFRQSDVPEVSQLSTMLMNVTPKGFMNRSHAYKGVVQANKEAGRDADDGVNMGLFTYPILMAADILLYGAEIIPVGADQKQHVEFARDIAGNFNRTYKSDILVLPTPVIQEATMEIPGLDGRKMSKSYDNTIPIFADEKTLKKLVMKIITDSKKPEEPKDPATSCIFQLHKIFGPADATEAFRARFVAGGMGYGDAKNALFEVLNNYLKAPRERYVALMADKAHLDDVLAKGAAAAREVAKIKLAAVSKAMLGR